MKKKICMILTALLMMPSFVFANGLAIHKDKAQHIGVCYATELVLAQTKPFRKWKPWQRILFTTVVIGGAKEWYDHNHPSNHTAEWGDIAADAVGAASAEGCIWLIHKSW